LNFETLHKIANAVGRARSAAGDRQAARIIERALRDETGAHWLRDLGRLAAFLRAPGAAAPFSILGKGNAKLPFFTFSTLPGVTCPGAGDCLDWCYSFKSWRYPAAFARQAQNTVLMRRDFAQIRAAVSRALPAAGPALDFRLYVDGDFSSLADIDNWRECIAANPIHNFYGYSKSINLLNSAPDMPVNYRLNLSSGHNASAADVARLERRGYVRGRFIAVSLGRPVKSAEHGDRAHQAELRAAHGAPAFTCPGECGNCTPRGHACGSDRFAGVDIIIAAH
jgi:hypothetical protein